MWFLLLKIFFLLCLAALFGAALAWWWLHRRMVDVTEAHAELTRQAEAAARKGQGLTREDIDVSLQRTLAAYTPPQPNLLPVQERLLSIENHLMAPNSDIEALHDRVGGLEQAISAISAAFATLRTTHLDSINQRLFAVGSRVESLAIPSLDPVTGQLARLETAIGENRAPDLRPVEARLERLERALENLDIPENDLGPIHSAIARLDLGISALEFPATHLDPLKRQIGAIEARVSELASRADIERVTGSLTTLTASVSAPRGPDLDPIFRRLAGIEDAVSQIRPPPIDLTPVADRLNRIENRLGTPAPLSDELIGMLAGLEGDLDALARRRNDLDPMYDQLATLDAALAALRADFRAGNRTEGLERRLAALQETILRQPAPDLGEIIDTLRSLAGRADIDLLESRLSAIEVGMTAVQNALRNRIEPPEPRLRAVAAAPIETRAAPRTTRNPVAPPAPPLPRRAAVAADPLAAVRRPGDRGNLLTTAAFGTPDELELINGIGPMLNGLLNGIGVYYFWQIAEWDGDDIAYVDDLLQHFRGRIERDDWVGQAKEFASDPDAARRPAGG